VNWQLPPLTSKWTFVIWWKTSSARHRINGEYFKIVHTT
jgi:hypothetical protein